MSEKKTFSIATPEELEASAGKPEGNVSPLLEPAPLDPPELQIPDPTGGQHLPERPILMGNPKGSRYTGWENDVAKQGGSRLQRSGRWIVLALLALSITAGMLIYLLIRHKL